MDRSPRHRVRGASAARNPSWSDRQSRRGGTCVQPRGGGLCVDGGHELGRGRERPLATLSDESNGERQVAPVLVTPCRRPLPWEVGASDRFSTDLSEPRSMAPGCSKASVSWFRRVDRSTPEPLRYFNVKGFAALGTRSYFLDFCQRVLAEDTQSEISLSDTGGCLFPRNQPQK